MTEPEVRALLALRLQPQAEPALTLAEVESLVVIGVAQSLRVALYMGWDAKAAKALADHDIASGDNELKLSQVYKHCIQQRDNYLTGTADGVADEGLAPVVKRGVRSVRTVRGI